MRRIDSNNKKREENVNENKEKERDIEKRKLGKIGKGIENKYKKKEN